MQMPKLTGTFFTLLRPVPHSICGALRHYMVHMTLLRRSLYLCISSQLPLGCDSTHPTVPSNRYTPAHATQTSNAALPSCVVLSRTAAGKIMLCIDAGVDFRASCFCHKVSLHLGQYHICFMLCCNTQCVSCTARHSLLCLQLLCTFRNNLYAMFPGLACKALYAYTAIFDLCFTRCF